MEQIKLISSTRGGLTIDKDSNIIKGYAVRFNEPSKMLFENNKRFMEVIHREAVESALSLNDVDIILNYNHDDNKMLARYNPSMGSDTLNVEIREDGLWIEAELPDTENGREVLSHMRSNNLYGMSFIFFTKINSGDVKWSRSEGGVLVRNVLNIRRISDVSVVRRPSYPTSSVQLYARAIEEAGELSESKMDKESKDLVDVFELKLKLYN